MNMNGCVKKKRLNIRNQKKTVSDNSLVMYN